MNFRTKIEIPDSKFKLEHQSKITCLGSCFANNIGNKLEQMKFDTLTNPTGIIYNPHSITSTINKALNKSSIDVNSLIEQQGRWVNYNFHSYLSKSDRNETIQLINDQIELLHHQIILSDILIITLGTAYAYQLIENGQIVNNCHKMPSYLFDRILLTPEGIRNDLSVAFQSLWQLNKKLNIIITVSPIRHLRDGFVENQHSKSILHLATQKLINEFDQVHYFPSYEIMIDDLRDYRFYNKDMIHPSEEAIDYIWSQFCNTYFTPKTIELNNKLIGLNKAVSHKPFNPKSKDHLQFKMTNLKKIETLKQVHPFLDLSKEEIFFST